MKKCPDCKYDETAEKLYDEGRGKCSKCENYETFKKKNNLYINTSRYDKLPSCPDSQKTGNMQKELG